MIRVKTSNIKQFKNQMQRINKNIAALDIPHKKISIMLDRWVQTNFKTEGGNVGGWAPIQRQGRILQDTGRLRASFLPFANKKNAGIGSDLPYAETHEEGIGVKVRRMLPELPEVRRDILSVYNKHIKDSAK